MQTPSLGEALEAHRNAKDWTSKRLALALGVPEQTLLNWKGDVELPHALAVSYLAHELGTSPVRVRAMVKESARRIVHQVLEDAAGVPRVRAARQRGAPRDESDRVLVENLPLPLRRTLARHLRVEVDAVQPLAEALRRLAEAEPERQRTAVEGMVAGMDLEGSDELPSLES